MSEIMKPFKKGNKTLKTVFMNAHKFSAKYAHTLHFDAKTRETYLKIPIADLEELTCLHEALLEAIQALSQLENYAKREPNYSTYWISKILLATYPGRELEGLTKLLGQKNTKRC